MQAMCSNFKMNTGHFAKVAVEHNSVTNYFLFCTKLNKSEWFDVGFC